MHSMSLVFTITCNLLVLIDHDENSFETNVISRTDKMYVILKITWIFFNNSFDKKLCMAVKFSDCKGV